MAFTSGMNPNVVKTALDDVFMAAFDGETRPGHASAITDDVFRQVDIDRQSWIMEVFKGVGYTPERDELEEVHASTPRIDDQITFVVKNYSDSVTIPKRYFDDEQWNTVTKMIEDAAEVVRATRNRNAFGIYRDAFDGNTYTTADGVSLVNDSHTNLNGDTIDNKLTAALTPESLNDAVVQLGEQKNQAGVIMGHVPTALLVPLANYKNAVEITDSELESDTADNAINVYSSKYGIRVYTTPFLGTAAGGSDNYWFLLSRNHSVTRFTRLNLVTHLRGWEYSDNFTYKYMWEFRETYGAVTYEGIVGSTGAA